MGWRNMNVFVVLAFLTAHAFAGGSEHKSHVTKFKKTHTKALSDVTLSNECAETLLGDSSYSNNPTIPPISWLQTPSIYQVSQGRYVVRSRVVHLRYLKEQLQRQKQLVFDAARPEMNLVSQLVIQADAVYIEGAVALHGINTLKIYTREIVSSSGGQLDVSAPNWNQEFTGRVQTARNGENGNHGVNGPQVEIYADIVHGALDVIANGGNGHVGQNGGNGAAGQNSGDRKPDKASSLCHDQDFRTCKSVHGDPGIKGPPGGNGGNAGISGNGGNAGNIIFRNREIEGKLQLRSCRGNGARAATNGAGGRGGAGGQGGKGVYCKLLVTNKARCVNPGWQKLAQAHDGARGDTGRAGTTPNTPGANGDVTTSAIQSGTLDAASKQGYPMALLKLMKRQVEDLLLSNPDDASGKAALTFIHTVASVKTGPAAVTFTKAVRRKLAFVGKKGFDIFGKNKLFAPRIKWDFYLDQAEDIKEDATDFENAFNDIISGIGNNEDFRQLAQQMTAVSVEEVEAEKARLVEARNIAQSEKRVYVKAIKGEEEKMSSILEQVITILPETLSQTKFNPADFLAVLQGLVGFVKAGYIPLEIIDTALGLASDLSASSCLGTLKGNLAIVKKWLTFGAHYVPLEDSSDLDFDQLDVAAVPEVMQADLELNKDSLYTQLVCMLEVKPREQDIAEFKQWIEAFFIAGATRIDLIGKVMDLDNEIGGHNFDIPLLEETQQTIADIKNPATPITEGLQLGFLESLLSTYREMERSFMREVYELHKAFKFRTLWEGNNPLATFQRVAAESAQGTERLNGIVELTKVLRNFKRIERKAVTCFTNIVYTTDIKKFSFDATNNNDMFTELWSDGYTRFNIRIDQSSCSGCHNVRLLKIYIELSGDQAQPANVNGNINMKVRHLSGNKFLAGDGTTKEYRQPIGSPKSIKFDLLSISDEVKCQEAKRQGNRQSSYCVTQTDSRWHLMCNSPLSGGSCRDSLLGEEECKSPFGTYEIAIPKDNTLECDDPSIRNTNCKDLDIKRFTKMNVWVYFFYWSDNYPTGPDDPICRSPRPLREN